MSKLYLYCVGYSSSNLTVEYILNVAGEQI